MTPSTDRDATYVLDLILDNEMELLIVEHTTDTYGVTDIVFALFDLLGLQFSPRIKGVFAYPVWGKRVLRTGAPPTTSHWSMELVNAC